MMRGIDRDRIRVLLAISDRAQSYLLKKKKECTGSHNEGVRSCLRHASSNCFSRTCWCFIPWPSFTLCCHHSQASSVRVVVTWLEQLQTLILPASSPHKRMSHFWGSVYGSHWSGLGHRLLSESEMESTMESLCKSIRRVVSRGQSWCYH